MSGCLNKSDRNIRISSGKILTLDKTQKKNENTQILKSA